MSGMPEHAGDCEKLVLAADLEAFVRQDEWSHLVVEALFAGQLLPSWRLLRSGNAGILSGGSSTGVGSGIASRRFRPRPALAPIARGQGAAADPCARQ